MQKYCNINSVCNQKRHERNYGIDLLRLVLMYMVCLLHILGKGGVLEACSPGTVKYGVFWFLEVCAYCAVDGFALISGYMASKRPQRYKKIVELWFQAVFYSFFQTVMLGMAGVRVSFESPEEFWKLLMPVTFKTFWYFTEYFALFFMMPILNSFLFSIDEKTAKKTFLVLTVLFSGLGVINDPFVSGDGYSAIWLIVLYCLGALAKKIRLFEKKSSVTLVLLFVVMCLGSWAVFFLLKDKIFINYISPTILFNGLLLIVFFSRLRIKGSWIKKVAPLAFGVYLFQMNPVIWHTVLSGICIFVPTKRVPVGVCYVLVYAAILFVTALLVEFLRSKAAEILRIPLLSQKIVNVTGKIFCRVFL